MTWGVVSYGGDERREPAVAVLLAWGLGAIAMWLAYLGQLALWQQWTVLLDSDALAAMLAAGSEEPSKMLAVAVAAWLLGRRCNDPLMGLLLGTMAGVGAGSIEMFWSLSPGGENPRSGLWGMIAPEVVRLAMHALWGGSTGYALGLVIMGRRWWPTLAVGLGSAVVLHFLWDFMLGYAPHSPWSRPLAQAMLMLSLVVFVYQRRKAMRWSDRFHRALTFRARTGLPAAA